MQVHNKKKAEYYHFVLPAGAQALQCFAEQLKQTQTPSFGELIAESLRKGKRILLLARDQSFLDSLLVPICTGPAQKAYRNKRLLRLAAEPNAADLLNLPLLSPSIHAEQAPERWKNRIKEMKQNRQEIISKQQNLLNVKIVFDALLARHRQIDQLRLKLEQLQKQRYLMVQEYDRLAKALAETGINSTNYAKVSKLQRQSFNSIVEKMQIKVESSKKLDEETEKVWTEQQGLLLAYHKEEQEFYSLLQYARLESLNLKALEKRYKYELQQIENELEHLAVEYPASIRLLIKNALILCVDLEQAHRLTSDQVDFDLVIFCRSDSEIQNESGPFCKLPGSENMLSYFDDLSFWPAFHKDLRRCKKSLVIFSAFIGKNRSEDLCKTFAKLSNAGVKISIYTRPEHKHGSIPPEHINEFLSKMQEIGIEVYVQAESHQKLAVIDSEIAWLGSLNILSHTDARELMVRIENKNEISRLSASLDLRAYSSRQETESDQSAAAEPESASAGAPSKMPSPLKAALKETA